MTREWIGWGLALCLFTTSVALFWLFVFHWHSWSEGWNEAAEIVCSGLFLIFAVFGVGYFTRSLLRRR